MNLPNKLTILRVILIPFFVVFMFCLLYTSKNRSENFFAHDRIVPGDIF